uniref:Uncharacterized protein n=1 Tax=Fagus sylvatica TaxID=28930 RepID=A0A2N9H211_FAGSY
MQHQAAWSNMELLHAAWLTQPPSYVEQYGAAPCNTMLREALYKYGLNFRERGETIGPKPMKEPLSDSASTPNPRPLGQVIRSKAGVLPKFPEIRARSSPLCRSIAGFSTLQGLFFHHYVEALPNSQLYTR